MSKRGQTHYDLTDKSIIASSPMGQAVKIYVLTLHADVIDLSVKS
jgi:hypothetical protein